MSGVSVRSTLTVSKQDEWGRKCGLRWPIALKLSTQHLNPGTKDSTEALWFSYQTTKLSLWGRRLLKRQLTWRFTRCSKANRPEPQKPGRPGWEPGWEPHPPARRYKSSGVWSGSHNSGARSSELPTALSPAPCPTTAPQGPAPLGWSEDPALCQWPRLPQLLLRLSTAWVAFLCPVPSKLAPGSWTTVSRPAASPLFASPAVTSKLLVSPALHRWPALDKPPVSLIPVQLPAAGHSPLSLVAVSPWEASLLCASQWEESPLCVNQPALFPEHTSDPVCPAAEEFAKCVGSSEWIKTPWPASCFQDFPACCLSSSLLAPLLNAWWLAAGSEWAAFGNLWFFWPAPKKAYFKGWSLVVYMLPDASRNFTSYTPVSGDLDMFWSCCCVSWLLLLCLWKRRTCLALYFWINLHYLALQIYVSIEFFICKGVYCLWIIVYRSGLIFFSEHRVWAQSLCFMTSKRDYLILYLAGESLDVWSRLTCFLYFFQVLCAHRIISI